MTQCSVPPRDEIFVNGHGYLSFTKNISKNIYKNISKSLRGKYSQKLLDHAKQSATDALKTTSKRLIKKTAEPNSDLIDYKIANKITKVSKNSQQNKSETITNKNDKETPKETYISPKQRQKIIHDLILI